MRRPPIACRRAVQSLHSPPPQHIWISDDLLSLALNRFFRTTCPQQKRHGSHVPGPLEARRRAAKRRMTVSAGFYPQDSLPSPFSLGALFGFRKDAQSLWRYEPPSLPQTREPLDLLPGISSPIFPIPPAASATPTDSASPYQAVPSFSQTIPQTILKREGSAVDPSLQSAKSTAEPQDVDFNMCFKTFRSRIAHAGNLSELEKNNLLSKTFRSCCPSHPEAWVYNVMVIKHVTELGWDPAPLIGKKAALAVPPTYTAESLELLRCAEQLSLRFPNRIQYFHRLHVKLAEAAVQADTSTSSTQDNELFFLVRQLWQSACPQIENVQLSAMALLCKVAGKLRNRYTAQTLQSVLADMKPGVTLLTTRASESQDRYSVAEHIFACIPRQHLLSSVPAITSDLAKAVKSKTRLPKSVYMNRLKTWLKLLHHLDSTHVFDRPGASVMDDAIATIAKHVFADRSSAQISPKILLNALVFKLTQQDALYATLNERLSQLISSSAAPTLEQGGPVTFDDWFGEIFSQMQGESLPYDGLAQMMLTILVQHNDLGLVPRFLTAMDKRKLKIRDASALASLVAERVAFLQQSTSSHTEKERQHNAFALATCQRIVELLSQITLSSVSSLDTKKKELNTLQAQRQFREILDRAQAASILPLAYRSLPADVPLEQRTALIHQLVHQYSLDHTRSHRQVWRSMFYLYSYLQQHSLPIGPLFTKAVVHVSIIRPLTEDRFVSARRLIWVCQLVASVEGEEVAKKVESIFWHWRGDLMRHAKSVYLSVGGDKRDKAHLGTMKRLGLI